ncbi:MAG: hypothetical protein K2G80_02720 [Bacteroidales bacterium]|nr:hypothetical protein [Bacteroidales bacterium]
MRDILSDHYSSIFQRCGFHCPGIHAAYGPEETPDELARLGCCIETYALNQPCPAELAPIHPQKLKNADLFHFGWNMAHYFGQPKQEVVPWLKTVFAPLAELEDSYIKGKLYSSEHFRHFETEHSEARLLRDEKGSGGFQLFIDLIPILQ